MRGKAESQETMLTLRTPAQCVPAKHPLRALKKLADDALAALSKDFDAMYSKQGGRDSIPPERLLKSMLLIALYTIRSERLFCEQLDYNLLFRWFLDMNAVERSFDHSSFSKNRDRLLEHAIAEKFLVAIVEKARSEGLLSDEHFTVDGTLIEAWASQKSFRPKDDSKRDKNPPDDKGNPTRDFHGEKRTNETHTSTTDPEAKLLRKGAGKEAKLCFMGHALMENRSGLLVDFMVTTATGTAEREAALTMLERTKPSKRVTLGADAGYDVRSFAKSCRDLNVTPHLAPHRGGYSALDARTTRHPGYAVSQVIRKRIEEIFGWAKTVGNLRRSRFRGVARTQLSALMTGAAYNLLRMSRMLAVA